MHGARQAPQFSLRMPEDLKIWLAHQAIDNRRSLNSEIIRRLEQSRGRDDNASTMSGEERHVQ